jgi:single-strand DNA-binding protein
MASVNKWIGIGNLGAEPETKYLPSGDAVTNFRIACSEKFKDKQTGEAREQTEWVSISAFGKLAEICGQYLHKGSLVYVEGKINTRKYTDKDGIERVSYTIRANEMKMLGGKPEGQDRPREAQKPAQKNIEPDPFDDNDPIPF